MTELTQARLAKTLNAIQSRITDELLATPQSELNNRWHFRWDNQASIDWNVYLFSQSLEAFGRDCRRWETHHHGHYCVVERVREKYLMPKIQAFRTELSDRESG